MSMFEMGGGHLPEGAVVSPKRRAILQHIQMHGEASKEQLLEALGNRLDKADMQGSPTAEQRREWLTSHLNHLRAAGHLARRVNEQQQVVWYAGTEPVEIAAPAPDEDDGFDERAAPRQIDVMKGPTYQPRAWVPARAGAADYLAIPSLMGTRRVPFRGAE